MTEIRSIHGIHKSELSDRGKMASPKAPYIPYTSLTKGEVYLALLYDQASTYAQAYPDFPVYTTAANMYHNALRAGVSRGVQFVGAMYDPILQKAASNILQASKQTAPAAQVITNRRSLIQGVNIGETPIYTGDFDHDCVQYATKMANKKFGVNTSWQHWKLMPFGFRKGYWLQQKSICETRAGIEKIMNDNMVQISPHMLYKSISEAFPKTLGTLVLTKKLLHFAGVGGLGIVSELSTNTMDSWVETALIRKNASSGVGTFGSISSSMSLAPDPQEMVAAYNDFLKKNPTKNPKFDKINGAHVGEPVTIAVIAGITALVTAIGGAIAKAAAFQQQLNAKKAGALSQVQGWGTGALEAKQTDYLTPGQNNPDQNSNFLLLGVAAVGAYLLLEK